MSEYFCKTDDELIKLLKLNDDAAFTEIYNRYWKLLLFTSYKVLLDEQAAQDAVQNVFISLWQRRHTVEIILLKAYLQQAARYSVLNAIRDNKKDANFYDRLKKVTSELIVDDPLVFKEQQALVQQLLSSLPANCTETFLLSREEGLTYKQIAERLEISEKTVEKRMSKSLKHLRNGLNCELCVAVLFFTTHDF